VPGWIVPPPRPPRKSVEALREEREKKVERLIELGLLRSKRIREALLKVPREDFIPALYRDYAYEEVPLPLPGEESTISCPHSYPLFYEPLGLDEGQRFLEVGLGSGYGTALAREIVGPRGLVVAIEIDPVTFAFARENLERAGYGDVVLVRGDGGWGHPALAPYDRICITAACEEIPAPLIEQLRTGGKLIGPVCKGGVQTLTLLVKEEEGVRTESLCEVLYVSLRGDHGVSSETCP
jgi:protein-L-isoaspartate(D-aspartate) O-methyltransferase